MADEFDEADLVKLREMLASVAADGPRPSQTGKPASGAPRTSQLNVRVRRATRDKARAIAKRRSLSLAEVVEAAIEALEAST
jgi:hypothetical protein